MFEQKPLYREEHLLGKIIVTKIYLIKLILRRKFDDLTKWSLEASGAYIKYSSIAEEGSSQRANFIAK